ncbi:RibD family protein [Collinsella vaginalis]|uniref:RibD family protein n=1 Tax=Collinsella vaginalis TaxID=1870987 RepID=UPI000A26B748|nr:RibD family protein [Collinsella vaginalis]
MSKPFVFCHMETSLDGKIMGPWMSSETAAASGGCFYEIAFGETPHYQHQGWLSGRVTTDDNFTDYRTPELDENAAPVPAGDFVADPDAAMHYVSIDPSGRLGWDSATLTYRTTQAHVVEVLSERASNAYKAFLRGLGISYIICGETEIDFSLMLEKLRGFFGIESLMLGGGGVLNWSFIQQGLCDELSIVLCPAANGSTTTPALFAQKDDLSTIDPVGFKLIDVERLRGDALWLRYAVKNG